MKQHKKLAFALAAVAATAGAWAEPDDPFDEPGYVIDDDPDWYEDTIEGYTWQYVIDGNNAVIIGIDPKPTGPLVIPDSVSLPGTVGGLAVVGVDNEVFSGCSGITSVTIPETFQWIGASAFLDCTSLATVDLGNATPDINFSAFSGCNSLKTFTVSSDNPVYKVVSKMLVTKQTGVLTCGVNGAVTIPSGVKTIGRGAFWGRGGLTSVKIPSGVTAIDMDAFRDCSALTSVTIPGGVAAIGECAFYKCSGLSSVTIPDSVTSIGESAFKGCKSSLFDTKTIPGVKLVDGWAVGYTSSLSGALDLTGVRGIAEGAFDGCTAITSVKLPNGLTAIPDYAFLDCTSLATITIPKSVVYIPLVTLEGAPLRTVWTEKGDTERVKGLLEEAHVSVSKITFKEIATSFKLTVKSSNTSYGTVSGSGTYDEGTKVTIQASAKSGYGFAGWYTDNACTKALNPKGYDNRKPAVKVVMPSKNTAIYAKFITKAEDKAALKVTSATKELATTPFTSTAGYSFSLQLGVKSATLLSFSSKTVPAGLTLETRTGKISGIPTVPGSYTMSVTVKTAAGNSTTLKVKIKILAPKWAQGTFNGYVFPGGLQAVAGYLTFTVGSTGKISGKVTYKGKTYSFTSNYTGCDFVKAEFTPPSLTMGSKTFKLGRVTVTEEELKFDGNGGLFYVASNAAGTLFAQKPFKFITSNGYLGALYKHTSKFTKNTPGSGLTGTGDWVKVNLVDDMAVVSGKKGGKSFSLSAPLNYTSKQFTSDGYVTYEFRTYIYDSKTGYFKWLHYTVKAVSDKKMSKVQSIKVKLSRTL